MQCFVKKIATNGSKQHCYKYVTDAAGLTVMFLVAQKSDVGSFDEASFEHVWCLGFCIVMWLEWLVQAAHGIAHGQLSVEQTEFHQFRGILILEKKEVYKTVFG